MRWEINIEMYTYCIGHRPRSNITHNTRGQNPRSNIRSTTVNQSKPQLVQTTHKLIKHILRDRCGCHQRHFMCHSCSESCMQAASFRYAGVLIFPMTLMLLALFEDDFKREGILQSEIFRTRGVASQEYCIDQQLPLIKS